MTPKQFGTNVLGTVIIGLLASIFGAVSTHWWSGALLGLGLVLTFTFISQSVLHRLHGRIGNTAVSWYFFDVLLQTVLMVSLFWGFATVFGVHVVGIVSASICAALVYILNCRETLKEFFAMLGMWLATRR